MFGAAAAERAEPLLPPRRPVARASGACVVGSLVACALALCAAARGGPAGFTEVVLGAAKGPTVQWEVPEAAERCAWVVDQVVRHQGSKSNETLREQYRMQVLDANMFYRGVDYIFWDDYVRGGWGLFELDSLSPPGAPALARTSTWTWITGDQHLSNFGAWKNRHGDVVFGVNDFDEAVVYDFQIDIYRLATSIFGHAVTNGLDEATAAAAVTAMAERYVETMVSYVGNEDCLLYEITSERASGALKTFLQSVERSNSAAEQLRRFTADGAHDCDRRFVFDSRTKLLPVEGDVATQIRRAWNAEGYGATLQRVGWHAIEYDDGYFRILDMAQRVGSGDGSFGASRYYLLISGGGSVEPSQPNVILDVKSTQASSAKAVLPAPDRAWYRLLFHNEAARAVAAQRRLTSYTDPFTGWVKLNGEMHVVRERSPWKASIDLGSIKEADLFIDFAKQVGVVTATSHARGSYGHSPAQFKEVIAGALGGAPARRAWAARVVAVAASYRKQVLLSRAAASPLRRLASAEAPPPRPLPHTARCCSTSRASQHGWMQPGATGCARCMQLRTLRCKGAHESAQS